MSEDSPNHLISSHRTTDTSPPIQLHPLVLLTISDYTTRHTLRQQEGPIVGAVLGQQNGREITMEVAFECKLTSTPTGEVSLDEAWFADRLEQFKIVFKSPALDLVGWFTLGSKSGPEPHHLPIQQQLMSGYNENAILLLFHTTNVYDRATSAGKLPLSLYETVWESSGTKDSAAMEVDGQMNTNQGKTLKFRELNFVVETGEAEMISVDFVARGGGNATAIDTTKSKKAAVAESQASQEAAKVKGKGKAAETEEEKAGKEDTLVLSPEDEEILSSITAKTNAIRMLHTRIQLFNTYLSSLPPSYLADPATPPSQTTPVGEGQLPIDHTVLRHLLSLLSRLPILEPPSTEQFISEAEEARSDTALVELLSTITNSVAQAKELGRKIAIVENARQVAHIRKGGLTSFSDAEGIGVGSGGGGTGKEGFLQTVLGNMDGRQLRERKLWQ